MATTSYSAVAFEHNRSVTVPSTIQSVTHSRYSLYPKNGSQPSDGTFLYCLHFGFYNAKKNAPEVNVQMKNMFLLQR